MNQPGFQENDFLREIARDRFLLHDPSQALHQIEAEILNLHAATPTEDFDDRINLLREAVHDLDEQGFTAAQRKQLAEFKQRIAWYLQELRYEYKDNAVRAEPIKKLYREIMDLAPPPARSLFSDRFEAVKNSLLKPLGATIAVGTLLHSFAQEPADELPSPPPTPHVEVIPVELPAIEEGGKDEAGRQLTMLREKYRTLKEKGVVNFSAYFDDVEPALEGVSEADKNAGKQKFAQVLDAIRSKSLGKTDFDLLRDISEYPVSPKDSLDSRNLRASSLELFADENMIGNCEARARSNYRLIEALRPELLAHIKVAFWHEHESLAYEAPNGKVYDISTGILHEIPKKLLAHVPLLTSMEAWVDPFLGGKDLKQVEALEVFKKHVNQPSKFGATTSKLSRAIGDLPLNPWVDNSDIKESAYRKKIDTEASSEAESYTKELEHDFVLNVSGYSESKISFENDLLNLTEVSDIESTEQMYLSIDPEKYIPAWVQKLKRFHHIKDLIYLDQETRAIVTEEVGRPFDPQIILEGVKKYDPESLVYISWYDDARIPLKDFAMYKNLKKVGFYLRDAQNVAGAIDVFHVNQNLQKIGLDTGDLENISKNLVMAIPQTVTELVIQGKNRGESPSTVRALIQRVRNAGYKGKLHFHSLVTLGDDDVRLQNLVYVQKMLEAARDFSSENSISYARLELRPQSLLRLVNILRSHDIQVDEFKGTLYINASSDEVPDVSMAEYQKVVEGSVISVHNTILLPSMVSYIKSLYKNIAFINIEVDVAALHNSAMMPFFSELFSDKDPDHFIDGEKMYLNSFLDAVQAENVLKSMGYPAHWVVKITGRRTHDDAAIYGIVFVP